MTKRVYLPFNKEARFVIGWDNYSKRFPFAVTTISGTRLAFFRTFGDAAKFAESL